jgi:mono/diheme cytochrome c family protein
MFEFRSMRWRTIVFFFALAPSATGAWAQSVGRQYYLADCSRCHGVDGTGRVAAMREVPGYRSVDLTQLSKQNGGQFPFQEVRDAIEGSKRFPAHLVGGMPLWGSSYQQGVAPADREKTTEKLSALVNYIESIQAK